MGETNSAQMHWQVNLVNDVVITIVADGTFEERDDRVFEILLGPRPATRVEVARVPISGIRDFVLVPRSATS